MSISHFFRILWVRRNLILLTTLAGLLAAAVIVTVIPSRYTATSRVMLDIAKPDPVTGQTMASGFMRAFVTTQVELIKDYRVAGRVVDQFNWTSSPALAAEYQASDNKALSFRRWLAQRIIDQTEVGLVSGSNILEISYSNDSPEVAAQVADALRDAYMEETRVVRQAAAQKSADWFRNQTEKLRANLTQAEARKTAFEKENNIVIRDDLTDNETARLTALASATDVQAPMISGGGGVPITAPSQAQLAQLDVAIETATRTLGPNHPRLVALRQQRAAVAATVQQELSAARSAARAPSVTSGPSASAMYQAQQAKVLNKRDKIGEGQQLAIDVSVLRTQVEKASMRTAELQQEADSEETGLSFLGSAVAPNEPSFPNVPLIVFGAIALGLGIGLGLALLIELLFRKVRGPSDLTIEGVPLIGIASTQFAKPEKPKLMNRINGLLPFRRQSLT